MEAAMNPHKERLTGIGEAALLAPYDAVQEQLLQARTRILTEIQHYPTPIPHCDQHFNWLLEQRDTVSAELQALEDLKERAAAALTTFVQASQFLDADVFGADPLPC
jgi:hypothetical protein